MLHQAGLTLGSPCAACLTSISNLNSFYWAFHKRASLLTLPVCPAIRQGVSLWPPSVTMRRPHLLRCTAATDDACPAGHVQAASAQPVCQAAALPGAHPCTAAAQLRAAAGAAVAGRGHSHCRVVDRHPRKRQPLAAMIMAQFCELQLCCLCAQVRSGRQPCYHCVPDSDVPLAYNKQCLHTSCPKHFGASFGCIPYLLPSIFRC